MRLIIHKCIQCIRYKPKTEPQLMGDYRYVYFTHTFRDVGVDYAGSFWIQVARRRDNAPSKTYVCVFVCLL